MSIEEVKNDESEKTNENLSDVVIKEVDEIISQTYDIIN